MKTGSINSGTAVERFFSQGKDVMIEFEFLVIVDFYRFFVTFISNEEVVIVK
jgi:hypothetical protein